ncbi:hypothetical protein LTR93_011188 [Exophiala xenobiotica]|nr:hypothetical protein LTR93_011188 [Exophiala xenobiotica]
MEIKPDMPVCAHAEDINPSNLDTVYPDGKPAIETQHSPVVKERTTKLMVLLSAYLALTTTIYNFDVVYGGIVLLMKPYRRAFGTCATSVNTAGNSVETCTLTALQQSLVSVTVLFIALGGAIGGLVGNYLGRRRTIQIGSIIIAIGAGSMLGTSGNFAAYIACKSIQCVGLGLVYTAVPAYGVECLAANKRGMLMSLLTIGLGAGYVLAAVVCLGSSKTSRNLAWQTPIICQLPLALLLGAGVLCFPESPRWLLLNGKEAEARKSLSRLYTVPINSPEMNGMVGVLQHYIELEREIQSTTNWTEIFRGVNLGRTLRSFLLVIGAAVTGARSLSTYSSIFFAQVGISNPYTINVVIGACSLLGSLPSPWLLEHVGRRLTIVIGYAGLGTCMLIIAAVGTGVGPDKSTAKHTLLVFISIWNFMYGACIGGSVPTVSPEMHSVRLRSFGHAATITIFEIFSFGCTFATPYMISPSYGNMGLNICYFFFGLSAISMVLMFFFIPETARLTLEQIDEIFFAREKAWKTSLAGNKRKVAEYEAQHE